jgi:hypothetical protein
VQAPLASASPKANTTPSATPFERAHFPEEGTILDEFNEVAYDECKRLAALIDGVVDDECLDYYETGKWLKDIYFARGGWANAKPPGFTCYEP